MQPSPARGEATNTGAEHIDAKPGEMPGVIVDTKHASSVGFVCEYDVLDGLKATWADFLERAEP